MHLLRGRCVGSSRSRLRVASRCIHFGECDLHQVSAHLLNPFRALVGCIGDAAISRVHPECVLTASHVYSVR